MPASAIGKVSPGREFGAIARRGGYTALERSENVAEWIRLTDKVLSQLATKSHVGRPEGGVRAAAREIGVDKDSAHRAEKIAALSDEAKEAPREARLDDNQSAP